VWWYFVLIVLELGYFVLTMCWSRVFYGGRCVVLFGEDYFNFVLVLGYFVLKGLE